MQNIDIYSRAVFTRFTSLPLQEEKSNILDCCVWDNIFDSCKSTHSNAVYSRHTRWTRNAASDPLLKKT